MVVILLLARLLTWAYGGLDGDGTYGIAVLGTRELAAAIDRYRGQYHHIPDPRDGLGVLAPSSCRRSTPTPGAIPTSTIPAVPTSPTC